MIDVWQGIPFFAVMLLAALQAIPLELEQAARVDGANPAQVLWHVKVPLLLPTILITTILRLIWTANYMDLMFVMTNGGPGYATTTMPFFAYTEAYRRIHFSTGATAAFVQALLLGLVIIVYIRILRRQQVV
jgi:multiple sugar transport system permease protein